MPKLEFSTTANFNKDLKRLKRKYPTLDDDLDNMKNSLLRPHYGQNTPFPNNAVYDIENLCGKNFKSCKIKKFACKSLKNFGVKSGFRIIYILQQEKNKCKITFLEIFHKNEKENENKELIKKFIDDNQIS